MTAKFIPVEKLTDYRKWRFAGIEQDQSHSEPDDQIQEVEVESELAAVKDEEPVESVELPSSEDIGRIYHDAHREGYEAGLVEGLEAGHAEGFEAGMAEGLESGRAKGKEQVLAEAQPLKDLFSGFSKAAEEARQEINRDVVLLALEIAQQLLRRTIKIKPDVVLALVKDAIESMPQGAKHTRIFMHPEDAALVKGLLLEKQSDLEWKVVDDQRLDRGGCRIECETSELDATLPSRWKRIALALGQDHSWLEHDH